MKDDKTIFLENFAEEEFQKLLDNFETDFQSWEYFLKVDIIKTYLLKSQEELNKITKNIKTNVSVESLINNSPYLDYSGNDNIYINHLKKLIENHGVATKDISYFKDKIKLYLKSKDIDIDKYSEEDKEFIYRYESFIFEEDSSIFKFFGLTQQQYQYLYQTGKVMF